MLSLREKVKCYLTLPEANSEVGQVNDLSSTITFNSLRNSYEMGYYFIDGETKTYRNQAIYQKHTYLSERVWVKSVCVTPKSMILHHLTVVLSLTAECSTVNSYGQDFKKKKKLYF